MENKKKFELGDEALDEVAGGYLMAEDATDGRRTTYVRTVYARCSKCGTNNGILFEWPSASRKITPYILCGNESNHDAADFSKILLDNPQPGDYTVGW